MADSKPRRLSSRHCTPPGNVGRVIDSPCLLTSCHSDSVRRSMVGAALVEFSILLPVLFLIFAVFWDIATGVIARSHGELSLLSLHFNFTRSPQIIVPDPVTFELLPQILSDSELATFQDEIHWLVRNSLVNAGSFADSDANVALEMYYWNIEPATGFLADLTADPNQVSPAFYTGPAATSNNCFGPPGSATRNALQAQFEAYRDAQFALIRSFQDQTPPIRFGENIFTSNVLGTPSSLYFENRATVFLMTCARRRPFSFFTSDPIVTLHTYMTDKEASWQIAP